MKSIHTEKQTFGRAIEEVDFKGDDDAHSCQLMACEWTNNRPQPAFLSKDEARKLGESLIEWSKTGPKLGRAK